MIRPKGNNADEWQQFLVEHNDNPVYCAVQIAEAIDGAIEEAIDRTQSDVKPDADRIAKLEREIYTLRANLVECADTLSAQQFNQAQQKRIEACRAELAALAQSNAEPVAWQRLAEAISGKSRWITGNEEMAKEAAARGMKVRPLYTTPPRPDASAGPKVTLDEIDAGMDRVLERHGFHTITNEARRYSLYNDIIESYQRGIRPVGHIDEFFGFPSITARASDRSGK